jgi:hypothetical protein
MTYALDEEELHGLNAIMDVCSEMSLCAPPEIRNAGLRPIRLWEKQASSCKSNSGLKNRVKSVFFL